MKMVEFIWSKWAKNCNKELLLENIFYSNGTNRKEGREELTFKFHFMFQVWLLGFFSGCEAALWLSNAVTRESSRAVLEE